MRLPDGEARLWLDGDRATESERKFSETIVAASRRMLSMLLLPAVGKTQVRALKALSDRT